MPNPEVKMKRNVYSTSLVNIHIPTLDKVAINR